VVVVLDTVEFDPIVVTGTVDETATGGCVVVVEDVGAEVVELAGTSAAQPAPSHASPMRMKVHHFMGNSLAHPGPLCTIMEAPEAQR
jgi:hypothetical protein